MKRTGMDSDGYRRFYADWRDRQETAGPWNADRIFETLEFSTADECVSAVAERYLSAPLSREQRGVLLKALGAEHRPNRSLTLRTLRPDQMHALLHLVTSAAEYQLC